MVQAVLPPAGWEIADVLDGAAEVIGRRGRAIGWYEDALEQVDAAGAIRAACHLDAQAGATQGWEADELPVAALQALAKWLEPALGSRVGDTGQTSAVSYTVVERIVGQWSDSCESVEDVQEGLRYVAKRLGKNKPKVTSAGPAGGVHE